jgi:diguanylate cyclase (GGDEF)-like protein
LRSTWGFSLKVAVPAALLLAVAIGAASLVLSDMAAQVDRIETTGREKSSRAALNAFLTHLRETHSDYAVWNDAVTNLYGTVNYDFVRTNIQDSTREGVLFDQVFLLDESGRDVFGYRNGQPALRSVREEFGPAIEPMIEAARREPYRPAAQAAFLKDHMGEIAAVAIGSVLPSNGEMRVPPGRTRLLVMARHLEERAIQRLSRDFVLDELTLVKDASGLTHVLPILDPLGHQIAALSWGASSRGTEALTRVAPTAVLAMTLICATMAFLLVISFRNQVELQRREQEAQRAAGQDGLTGLPNRRALGRALGDAVQTGRDGRLAVIYLDLDGFKEVNDTYGHEIGDRLLVKVAAAFARICEGCGILSRVGGDEFAVVMHGPNAADAAGAVAETMVRACDEPFDLDGRQVQISTSAGVAATWGEPISADELTRRADVAMYLAKEFGRNRVAFYDPSIDAAKAERVRLAEDLRNAIRLDNLAVVYQPIFDAGTMRPSGVEALLRWLHPELGLVPPDKFVPIAEESGLIEPIGEWVLRRACRDALAWPDVKLSVNVSPVQFRNPGFDTLLAKVLADTGFPPRRLEIEMTETHLVANPDRAQAIIASLRAIGVTVSLDDFGTGYSSIGYLRRFTFDKVKIDRSLVVGVTGTGSGRELCEATIALARALDLSVTAEGVETEQEAEILTKAGCDDLQGYAFARPMSADVVGSFLVATLSRPLVVPWIT